VSSSSLLLLLLRRSVRVRVDIHRSSRSRGRISIRLGNDLSGDLSVLDRLIQRARSQHSARDIIQAHVHVGHRFARQCIGSCKLELSCVTHHVPSSPRPPNLEHRNDGISLQHSDIPSRQSVAQHQHQHHRPTPSYISIDYRIEPSSRSLDKPSYHMIHCYLARYSLPPRNDVSRPPTLPSVSSSKSQ